MAHRENVTGGVLGRSVFKAPARAETVEGLVLALFYNGSNQSHTTFCRRRQVSRIFQ